jgi:hypothetical protein
MVTKQLMMTGPHYLHQHLLFITVIKFSTRFEIMDEHLYDDLVEQIEKFR